MSEIIDLKNFSLGFKISVFKQELLRRNNNLPEYVWTIKDGSKIKVTDMSDQHIKRCIDMLEYAEKCSQCDATELDIY